MGSGSPARGDGAARRRPDSCPKTDPAQATGPSDVAGGQEEVDMTVLADSDYPLLDVMWTMFVFFMWCIWIWLLITVFSDLFRRRDVSGWGKAGWTFGLLVLPFLGVFIYLVSQGQNMHQRQVEYEQAVLESRGYTRAASNGHAATEISQAKQLLDDGAITSAEFDTIKQKALAG
jgi:hypothetical protein